MYNSRNFCFYSFSASVSFDFETRIMSTCMSTSRSNYTDMSIWKKHADHNTSYYIPDCKLACLVLYLKIINIFLKNDMCLIVNSYTLHAQSACCSQSELTILKIRESSAHALFLYNCTPNTLRALEHSVAFTHALD